ncbi:MAG: GumC family protein [bacterium]
MTLPKQIQSGETGQTSKELQLRSAEASPPEQIDLALSFKDVVAMIYRRRWLASGLFSAVFLIVAVFTVLQPSIYATRAQLLFKKERINTVVSASDGAAVEGKPQLSEEALNSEIEILKSSTLMRDVLRHNQLYQQIIGPEKTQTLDSTTALELAVVLLKSDLNSQIVPKSNIVQVMYEAKDPQLATQIVNELCQRYVIRHLEVHENKGAYNFFQKQAEVLRDTLQIMASALQQFESEHNLIAPDQQRQLFLQKLADYETQLNTTRANVQAASRQVDFLEKQLAGTPERVHAQNEQASSAVRDALTKELESLKLKYDLMVQAEKDPAEPRSQLARSLKARIAQIEETLHQQQVAEKPEVSTDINQAMMSLAAELTRARFDLIGYKERENEMASAIARLRQDLKNHELASFTHEAMVRQLQLAQSNYLLYAKKQEEARISEALDREQVANVSIIDPASVPLDPVSPNRQLNLVMGFVLALFVGLGTAWGVSFFDDVVHTSGDVERQINVPVIVSIPEGQWPPNLLPESMLEPGNFSAHSS